MVNLKEWKIQCYKFFHFLPLSAAIRHSKAVSLQRILKITIKNYNFMKAIPSVEEMKSLSSDAINNEANVVVLPKDQEDALIRQYQSGDLNALKEILKYNICFVVSVADNYQNKGLDMPELIAHGTHGLVEAAKSFDESKGVRFLSYAIWWIRQSIIEEIDK
jgi:RNA polymerase primary sigma factor